VFRTYIETTETNRTVSYKPKQTKATLNILKNTQIYSLLNCLVGLLFVSVQSNIKTICFGIEAKQPKQTVSKQTKKNEKIEKYAPYQTVSVGLLFVLVQSKHRKSLFRYRNETTETNVLFRIVPKLVSFPVSVVFNRN
jgi:hypothetical protein